MTLLQTLGDGKERGYPLPKTYPASGGFLANESIQSHAAIRGNVRWFFMSPPLSKLERLKMERFTPEGRAERIAKSLAALGQVQPIQLSREQWKAVAEAPVEDQF